MTFRITTDRGAVTSVSVAGRLDDDGVGELLRTCSEGSSSLVIDLSQVVFADDAGVQALKDLRQRGATLVGARPYLALLLDQNG